MSKEMKVLYTNYYKCPQCNYKWEDDYDCQPDDDCPSCGQRHISPYESKTIKYDDQGDRVWGEYEEDIEGAPNVHQS